MEDDCIPPYATGPDCFENDEQRREAKVNQWCAWEGTMPAYELGSLHMLAHAIERFRAAHPLPFRNELLALSEDLARVVNWIDQGSYSPHFPLQPHLRNGRSTH
ncbi:hypothetical protein W02_38190 [Nitrospira sp. KM1]|uniref:hypothetical protein n=1 Tax=Nitrospira sp. KM1 TaxID=1936990 RepID=UPI0013A71404|nr:hypothetical protein [Nitrospira sp. KM1]BCA56679.1 hypothetical protein W02_38190 [Nitrospira sp. KM1]